MTPPPRFLSVEDVLTLHAIAIEAGGGDPSLRDRALLESAVATPAQQFEGKYLHEDIPAMAAAYAFHICKNHAFVDGNKRAAAAAMIAFLSDNGWSFDATADEAEPVILQMAAGSLDKGPFTEWVRQNVHEKPRMELRDFFEKVDGETLWKKWGSIVAPMDSASPTAEDEILRTCRETENHIPAARWFQEQAVLADKRGDTEAGRLWIDREGVLICLYRVAEDMGYEW
jgi:death-on-curing protein